MKTAIILYVPVLHRSYQEFFQEQQAADLFLFTREELLSFPEFDYLQKDLRYLDENFVEAALKSWQILGKISLFSLENLPKILNNYEQVILSNDDIGQYFQQKCQDEYPELVEKIRLEPLFLRWDKNSIVQEKMPEANIKVTKGELERHLMQAAFKQANFSTDWWRQVGAILLRDDQVLLYAYNRHLPSRDQQNELGDPRCFFQSGEGIEFSSSIHAEAELIASAAKMGIPLEGAEMYCTTFPCPVCAKQIAAAGVKRLYFATGYAVLDGLEVLQASGVEVTQVIFDDAELAQLREEQAKSSKAKDCYQL